MLLSSSLVDYIRSENRLTTCFLNLLTEGIKLAQLITKGSCHTGSVTETRVSKFLWHTNHITVSIAPNTVTCIGHLADVPKRKGHLDGLAASASHLDRRNWPVNGFLSSFVRFPF